MNMNYDSLNEIVGVHIPSLGGSTDSPKMIIKLLEEGIPFVPISRGMASLMSQLDLEPHFATMREGRTLFILTEEELTKIKKAQNKAQWDAYCKEFNKREQLLELLK